MVGGWLGRWGVFGLDGEGCDGGVGSFGVGVMVLGGGVDGWWGLCMCARFLEA